MIDFLGDDKCYYTRYSENENIRKVQVAYVDNLPAGWIAYWKKISEDLLRTVEGYAKEQGCHTLFLDTRITLEPTVSIYRAFGFNIVFQQGMYIQMEKKLQWDVQ